MNAASSRLESRCEFILRRHCRPLTIRTDQGITQSFAACSRASRRCGEFSSSSSLRHITRKYSGQCIANCMYPSPAASRSFCAFFTCFGSMALASRSKPSAASSVSKPARLPKWLAGAPWETPAFRAQARSVRASTPESRMISSADFSKAARRSPW